jgi:hypothetical protein
VNDVFGSLPDAYVWMSQMATFSWLRLPHLRPLFEKGTSRAFDPNAALPSFENMTRDVDVLLSYAATAGISLRDADVTNLTSGENNKTAFIQSYSRVALALIPVTAFALRKFFASYRQNVRFYVIGGILLAIIVIFFSLFTFISTAISESLRTEIDLANSKIINLLTHLADKDGTLPHSNPPPFAASTNYSLQDLTMDLQQFATSLRSIDSRAKQLHRLVYLLPVKVTDPTEQMRLSPDSATRFQLNAEEQPELNFARLLPKYQQVREYAQDLRDAVTFWSGGVATSILPVLYAILGVCALSLRRMQVAIRDKTFSDSSAKEHMVVAVIAGMMITLFSGLFTTSGLSLPPLALAFLAGYSSDAFFRILEGVIGPRAVSASNQQEARPDAIAGAAQPT